MTFRIEIIDMKTRHSGLAGGRYFGPKCCVTFIPKALNETNFQTKTKTIKLHLLDMNPYLPGMLGSLTLLLTSGMKPMSIILSASSSTKPSLDGTQSSSVEESPLSPLSQTQSIAFLLLYLSPRRPSHIAFSCLSPPSRSCLLSSRSCLLSSRSCLLSFRSYLLSFVS